LAKLCVTLTETTTEGMLEAMHRLPRDVDMVEVRLDFMEQVNVRALCLSKDRAIVVTNRPVREGGRWAGSETDRIALLREAAESGADFVDIELDSVGALGQVTAATRRIVSYHNFTQTPQDLGRILHRLASASGEVAKIAVKANDITDALAVFELLEKHASQMPLIALSMGEEGIPTRVLAGKFGAFLSYCCLSEDRRAADGQIPYRDALELYRCRRLGPRTALYGVVANPVAHSMSPLIHNTAFAELGLDAVYLPFKVRDPAAFLAGYERFDLRGLSVTIPHKEAMVALMDEVDELTARIGALNTVSIEGGRRYGCNTDVSAALSSIERAAAQAALPDLETSTVLLLGAGGAARAIAYGLCGKVAKLVIANRTVERARKLAAEVGAGSCGLGEIRGVRPDILINSTSVGMAPEVEQSPVPAEMLRAGMVVFDAVYNPIRTRLLTEAQEAGCATATGFEWFVNQAAAQFELWTGQKAPVDSMARAVRRKLGERERQ